MINLVNGTRDLDAIEKICETYWLDIKDQIQNRIRTKEFRSGKRKKKVVSFFPNSCFAQRIEEYLWDMAERIVTCEPDDFLLLEQEFNDKVIGICKDCRVAKKQGVRQVAKKTAYVFDYTYFIRFCVENGDEVFYKLVEALAIPTCPYCNRSYLTLIRLPWEDKRRRPPLDHFLPKSKYPMFSVSFYNLVPCCWFCNSSLKGTTDFNPNEFVSPYEKKIVISDKFWFRYKMTTNGNGIQYTTGIEYKDNVPANPVKKTLDSFAIQQLYQENHNDLAEEIRTKALENSDEYRDVLFAMLRGYWAASPQDFYRFYFGNYCNVSDFEKRPLAKFTHDLVKDLRV